MTEPKKSIDPEVLAGYNAGVELGRLHTDLGLIELARTLEVLEETLPPPPAVVYDVGGGYGEYAWRLADKGYRVHLFDLAQTNIDLSATLAGQFPGVSLESAEVADARGLNRPFCSADAVLLLGPLYHITQREERLAAIRECCRVLRPGGVLYAAAITRFATLLWALTVYGVKNTLLEEPAFQAMVARELRDGQHIRPEHSAYRGIGRSFFHLPDELKSELAEGGFRDVDVRGVIGASWLVPGLDQAWENPARREAILHAARLLERQPDVMGASTHLLAVARK